MKPIGQIVTTMQNAKRSEKGPRVGSGSSDDAHLPDEWIRALFAKFAVRYGHKWTGPLDSDAMMRLAIDEWGRGLAGISGEEIRHGLDSWDGEWPPTLPEFKSLCKPRVSAAHKPFIGLPSPEPDKAKAKTALMSMRSALKPLARATAWQEIHGMRAYV